MIIKFTKTDSHNKAVMVETIRRAIVRDAASVVLSKTYYGYRLFIYSKGLTKDQKKEIKRYIH